MERDPHQLIEGRLICRLRGRCTQAFLYVRGELALGAGAPRAGADDAYARGHLGRDIFGSGYRPRRRAALGRRRLHRAARRPRCSRASKGNRGDAAHQAAVLPAIKGLYQKPTVVNNVETLSNLPWIVQQRRRRLRGAGQRTSPPGTRIWSPVRPRQPARQLRGRARHDHLPRPALRPPLGGGIREGSEVKAFIPGGASAPWFGPDQLDLSTRPRRGAATRVDARLGIGRGHGREHLRGSCGVAHREVLRPRVVRQVHAVPRGWLVAGEDPAAHRAGSGARGGSRPAARRLRQPRSGPVVAAGSDHDLRARALGCTDRLGRTRFRSACSGTSTSPTSKRAAARSHEPGREYGHSRHRRRSPRSRPRPASWSSPRPSGTASTSRASAGTRA